MPQSVGKLSQDFFMDSSMRSWRSDSQCRQV